MAAKQAEQDFQLAAVSPLDGRYRGQLGGLGALVGEGALIRQRVRVEVEWLLHMDTVPGVSTQLNLSPGVRRVLVELQGQCQSPAKDAALPWLADVKAHERTTNHDVKAVEYFLRDRLTAAGAKAETLAMVHFACTSEDINNLAYALMLTELRDSRLLPLLSSVIQDLAGCAGTHANVAMLARTHGQTATPTTMGKEFAVFGHRLERQRLRLKSLELEAKFNGAVGNYNAHQCAYPALDWEAVARSFVETRLGLKLNPLTTQIENHDTLVEFTAVIMHTNTVLIGLCRDLWGYISLGYFRQPAAPGEVGSSTMPHKVNPIDFENAEGNLGLANALGGHFAEKLPISRWQRDLSDSTVLRALGTLFGHTELAWRSLRRGLSKIVIDAPRIAADLDQAFEVLAEPVQTVLRAHGVVDAYERLKAATRGQPVTQVVLAQLIESCTELPEAAKAQLLALTPAAYTGDAARLALRFALDLAPKA